MANQHRGDQGMRQLIRKYVREFRIAENLHHYAPDDLSRAQKHFVKLCLTRGLLSELQEVGR
ncbi:MAG: hypothetical protein WAM73_02580 [Desulfobacterales bacterium]